MDVEKNEKILGYILLSAGLMFIFLAAHNAYSVFTGSAPAPKVFNMDAIVIPATKNSPEVLLMSGENFSRMIDLACWYILMFFFAQAGGKIAGLGIQLIKEIKVTVKSKDGLTALFGRITASEKGLFQMVGFIIRLSANIVALLAVVEFVPGINVDNSRTLVAAALVLGLVNAVLRPFVLLLTLPLNVLSLGLLTFFINGFLFYLVSKMVKGFYVSDYFSAFLGAMAFSLVSFLLNLLIKPRDKNRGHYQSGGDRGRSRRSDVIDVQARHEKKIPEGGRKK